MSLKGKQIFVTGGAGSIGSLLCRELSSLGAEITIVDRSNNEVGFKANIIKGDLSTPEEIENIIKEIADRKVDILVNLAGIQYFGLCEKQSAEHTASLLGVNLLAPILLTQAILPRMKKQGGGHIVNIGSTFGSINFAHFATYSSSKAGLRGFSEALRREVKGDNIDVTYIAPRAVKTPLNTEKILQFAKITKMNMDEPEWVAKQIVKAIVKRRKDVFLGFPEKLFVRINAIAPRIVDMALAANDTKAKILFKEEE